MRVSVDFPSVAARGGAAGLVRLAGAIESAGYDDVGVFDYVVMGYGTEERPPLYPPRMPILESLVTLGFIAGVTSRVTLSTAVLKLPQRQAALVAKQASTVDVLSDGRLRLGVGVGWQEAEYEALGEPFAGRGSRMDESIDLLRACWGDERIECTGQRFRATGVAMEPKPVQGRNVPIWIGGTSSPAYRRVVRDGDGWIAGLMDDEARRAAILEIGKYAEEAGRELSSIGLQSMLAAPPRESGEADFYRDDDAIARRAEELMAMGFGWLSVNATAVFQSGARDVEALVDSLGRIHDTVRRAVS